MTALLHGRVYTTLVIPKFCSSIFAVTNLLAVTLVRANLGEAQFETNKEIKRLEDSLAETKGELNGRMDELQKELVILNGHFAAIANALGKGE